MDAPGHIEMHADPTTFRRWHLRLLRALTDGPAGSVGLSWAVPSPTDRTTRRLFALERAVARRPAGPSALVDPAAAAGFRTPDRAPDLVIDLSPHPKPGPVPTWTLAFDGQPGEGAAVAALIEGRTPTVTVVDQDGRIIAAGRPGSETPGVVALAFEDLLAGCSTLLLAALAGHQPTVPELPATGGGRTLGRHLFQTAVGAVAHRAYRGLYRAPHWRVGWRRVDGPGVLDRLELPASGWQELPDDGYRFYADPFPFVHAGRTHLFVEDFDHRTGRGVISVVGFTDSGPIGVPRVVLEHDVHLSYPFVLAHDGEVWMIPETSAAQRIELFRAVCYPDIWTREEVLVDGVEASDATVFSHDGTWWMLATVRSGGSFSDALHLWHAPDLRGPWTAHRANPVLLDIASARPAGRVELRDGRLLRPAQDGRTGYGAALTLVEITVLDKDHYEQRVLTRLTPGGRWPGRRLHTLNRAGTLECIDGSAMAPRWRRAARG